MNLLKKILPFLLILTFSYFAFKPLLTKGFFPIHDDTQVARVYEMTKALKDGMFPVRWSSDLGYSYGYPLFNFYDPLPYYIGGFLGVLGFNALFSTKILIILAIVLSGLSMYLLSKEYFGKYGAVFSSLLYIYAPYHALDTYVRGDLAELWAYAAIPSIFFGLLKLQKEFRWKYVAISSISFAGLITSHNLTAMFTLPFVFLFVLFLVYTSKNKKLEIFKNISIALFIGLALSSFYALPAVFEMNYTNVISQIGGGADYKNHFVCFYQLWASPWAYGGSAKGCIDGLSFMVGKFHIVLSLVIFTFSLILIFWRKYAKKIGIERTNLLAMVFFYFCFLFSIFFTLNISKPVWDLLKPMAFIQYPWRFLILAVFFSSLTSGFFIQVIERIIKDKKLRLGFIFISLATIIFLYSKFFVPQVFLNKSVGDYINKYQLTWVVSKTSDEYMPKSFHKPKNFYEIPDSSNLITQELSAKFLSKKTQDINLNLSINKSGRYIFPIAFFPAWKAYVDDKPTDFKESTRGISLNLPEGMHTLSFKFKQTPIEILGNLLSITGVLILFIGIIYLRPKHE